MEDRLPGAPVQSSAAVQAVAGFSEATWPLRKGNRGVKKSKCALQKIPGVQSSRETSINVPLSQLQKLTFG